MQTPVEFRVRYGSGWQARASKVVMLGEGDQSIFFQQAFDLRSYATSGWEGYMQFDTNDPVGDRITAIAQWEQVPDGSPEGTAGCSYSERFTMTLAEEPPSSPPVFTPPTYPSPSPPITPPITPTPPALPGNEGTSGDDPKTPESQRTWFSTSTARRLTRRAVARQFDGEKRKFSVRCTRAARPTHSCAVSWRTTASRYRGTVTISAAPMSQRDTEEAKKTGVKNSWWYGMEITRTTLKTGKRKTIVLR